MSEARTDGRALTGAGASLFRAGLARLVRELDAAEADGLPLVSGVRVFDGLGPGEKLAALERAGRRMLVGDADVVARTAVSDAAVAAVYLHLTGEAALEADEGATATVRRLVRAACAQAGWPAADVPRAKDVDAAAWALAIDRLLTRVMPEPTWALEWPEPDANPDAARAARAAMGVADDDYFVAVAPDPTPTQLSAIRGGLRRLARTRSAPPAQKRRVDPAVTPQPPMPAASSPIDQLSPEAKGPKIARKGVRA